MSNMSANELSKNEFKELIDKQYKVPMNVFDDAIKNIPKNQLGFICGSVIYIKNKNGRKTWEFLSEDSYRFLKRNKNVEIIVDTGFLKLTYDNLTKEQMRIKFNIIAQKEINKINIITASIREEYKNDLLRVYRGKKSVQQTVIYFSSIRNRKNIF